MAGVCVVIRSGRLRHQRHQQGHGGVWCHVSKLSCQIHTAVGSLPCLPLPVCQQEGRGVEVEDMDGRVTIRQHVPRCVLTGEERF